MTVRLFESLATTDALAGAFSDETVLAAMARFETALARAQATSGIIPSQTADLIARAAMRGDFDATAIARDARASGTFAIPFVERLRSRVHAEDPAAATFVHWGSTSQDLSDTALVLCLLDAHRVIERSHGRLTLALRQLADTHGTTIMLARTLLQPAPPTTLGLKAAGWFAAELRGHTRMSASFRDACVLQFGGASGTLAALGDRGPEVAAALAAELDLRLPDAPWHAHRDRLAALVTACGVYTGTLGKIARDVSLLMQHEVGEAAEPGGGSSSMPNKRNPSGCAIALAAATRLPGLVSAFLSGMVQEHERGLGGWHAEATTVAAAIQATGSSVEAMAELIGGLSVDSARMLANVDATKGTIFAERAMVLLAPALGREGATRVIAAALAKSSAGPATFSEMLAAEPGVLTAIDPAVLSTLGTAGAYLGSAEYFRRRLTADEPE